MLAVARDWNFFKAAGKPTAKDYPVMPDLCHLDGIENVGYGSHNNTPSAWIDLTGHGCDVTSFVSTSSVASDCFVSVGNGVGAITASNAIPIRASWANGEWTEEIVFKPDTYSGAFFGQGQAARVDVNGVFFRMRSRTVTVGIIPDYGSLAFDAGKITTGRRLSFVVTASAINGFVKVYNNGSLIKTRTGEVPLPDLNLPVGIGKTIWKTSDGHLTGEFCELRSHSRALTADEIAANYAVDKERFGLP